MSLTEVELAQRAVDRYAITIIGGNAIFLADRLLGHSLYMGPEHQLAPADFRRYVLRLTRDLESLTTQEFFSKYDLKG
jgi:hypothetical protein